MTYLLAAVAALLGAAGVVSAAAGSHTSADPRIATLSQMLMIHAAAALGVLGVGRGSPLPSGFAAAAALMLAGVALFAGDLAARVHLGGRLFPFAAPIGGSLMIGGWVVTAAVAAFAFLKR
jgi:uncharacterized membrane protein YgdD (TMEM256/DUF423 family)